MTTWEVYDGFGLIYAKAQTHDRRYAFCLRFIFHFDEVIADEGSPAHDIFSNLVKDAKFHSTSLQGLEGRIVPQHHGLWTMDTGDWAGTVLFSLTQWCGTSFNDFSPTLEERIIAGRSFEVLHDAGIAFSSVQGHRPLGHALLYIDAYGGKHCYIVGFSAGLTHRCERKVPVLPVRSFIHPPRLGCREIKDVILFLHFFNSKDVDAPTIEDVLAWHAAYFERNPAPTNRAALVALRHKLFPQHKPLYSEKHWRLVEIGASPEYPLIEFM